MAPPVSGQSGEDGSAVATRLVETTITDYVGATDSIQPDGVQVSNAEASLPILTTAADVSPAFVAVAGASAVDEDEDETDDELGDLEAAAEHHMTHMERLSTLDPSSLQTLLSGGLGRFYGKVKRAAKKNNLSFPTPEVHFENMSYTVWLTNESSVAKSSIGGHFHGLVAPWRKLRTVKKTILHPMTGMISPGSLTLVLANPGAGKSTFLKAIAGKLKSRAGYRAMKGMVTYSGLLAEEIIISKLVGLVDQLDNHFPTLTVRETIHFADRCLNGPPESKPAKLQEVARLRTELILHMLGLSKCADTCVGDALLRGVSGGERKRVTLGEMLVGGQSLFLCDEISTGLDSAAVFDIVTSLRTWTRSLGGSAVVALLQPPPEVVELFDDVILLVEGRLVFHGPRVEMLPYFDRLGFACPQGSVDPAEFVIDVVSGRGGQYLTRMSPVRPPRSAAQFEEFFHNSTVYKRTLAAMAEKKHHHVQIKNESEMQQVAHELQANAHTSPYKNSFWGATALLLERQRKVWFRDRSLGKSKMIEAVSDGLILGIIYLGVTTKLYLRMFFFLIAIFQRQAWQQVTISFQMRHVFYKQRSRNFHRTLSFTLAESLVQMPLNVGVSLVLVVIFYFMSGLSRDPGTFFTMYAIIVSFQHCMNALFGLLASLSPSIPAAQALISFAVSFFLLFSGNIILPDLIPSYWVWMHWFNPLAWALRALLLNEFHAARYSDAERSEYLAAFQVSKGHEFVWFAVLVLLIYYVLFTLLNTVAMRYLHFEFTATAGGAASSAGSLDAYESKLALCDAQHVVVDLSADDQSKSGDQGANATAERTTGHPTLPPCVPAYLVVRDLNYFVEDPAKPSAELQLLHGVTASFPSGTMTALMGSSGAGKTTFMDVLAGRKTGGRIEGDILLNGEPKDPGTFSRVAGYCEQMDMHSGGATVREALEFSATLRLAASTTAEERRAVVEGAMDLLELRALERELVRNCSAEQKKRVTIGVEMVANPSVLFLDEPTSGLDARSAAVVMRGVRSIARSGRTVLCTIHQPSKSVFALFDRLLLLQKGGHAAFFGDLGPDARLLLEYLSGVPGTPPMPANANPATYMLEVIGAGIGRGSARDYAVEYAGSALCAANRADVDRMTTGDGDGDGPTKMVPFSSLQLSAMARGFPTQFTCCARKMTLTYWRSPQYNFVRMVMLPVYAVIFGSTFLQLKVATVAAVNSHVGLMYNTLDFCGVISLMTVLDTATSERAVFYRERMSNYYGPLAYALSMLLAELPYLLFITFVFMNVEYWMVGWTADAFFLLYWFVFFLHLSVCTAIGQFMAVLMPNIKVANVAVGTISVFLNLYSGFLMPHPQMRAFYGWFRYLILTNYSLESLVAIALGRCDLDAAGIPKDMHGCTVVEGGGGLTAKELVGAMYDFRFDKVGENVAVLIGYWVAIQLCIYLTLRFVSHLKR